MTEQPEQPQHLQLRASDADRERVAKILHDAMGEGRLTLAEVDERLKSAYEAKTLGDLVPLTADLPVAGNPLTAMVPAANTLPTDRFTNRPPGPNASIGVLSGFDHKGEWIVPPTHTCVCFMGGGSLDLTEARFTAPETIIYTYCFMGGVEIKAPDDITVHSEVVGFMGGTDNKAVGDAGPGRPVVRVRGFVMMGGVSIERPKKRKKNKANKTQLES